MIWLILGVVIAVLSVLTMVRKGVAGIPLAVGLVVLYATVMVVSAVFPPPIELLLLVAFSFGIGLALVVWGVVNYVTNYLISKPLYYEKKDPEKGNLYILKPPKAIYAVMYGWVPWNDVGADFVVSFLNEVVWMRGYKVYTFDVEKEEIGGAPWALIWGIAMPKTIIDRILY